MELYTLSCPCIKSVDPADFPFLAAAPWSLIHFGSSQHDSLQSEGGVHNLDIL